LFRRDERPRAFFIQKQQSKMTIPWFIFYFVWGCVDINTYGPQEPRLCKCFSVSVGERLGSGIDGDLFLIGTEISRATMREEVDGGLA